MSKVSVIVPVYNGEKYIKKCIDSITNQTFKDFELIVVNDGSTDNTLKILNEIKDKRLIILDKKNGGVSSARNMGYSRASGKYVLFFDSDDFMENEMLEIMVNDIENNDVQAVRCNLYIYYEDTKIKEKYYEYLFNGEYHIVNRNTILESAISGDIMAFSPNMLFKRNDNINLYNEKIQYMEDVIFYVTILKDISKIYIENRPLFNYVKNKNSSTNDQEKIMINILSLPLYKKELEKELKKQGFYTEKRIKKVNLRLTILVSDLLAQKNWNKGKIFAIKEFKQVFENDKILEFINNTNIKKLKLYKRILIILGKSKCYRLLYYYMKVRKVFSYLKKRIKRR